jgi:uncharacterized caspase-like protein
MIRVFALFARVIIALSVFAGLAPAFAGGRVALVLGNAAYQHVPTLANSLNDAESIATTFRNAGFDTVELRRDLRITDLRRALRDFSDKARDADVAVVYYAGHGIEVDGTNYLIPTDAVLERDIDAPDEAMSLDRVLTFIEPAKQLRLVILDACRDNPFNKSMKRTIGSRAVTRGLAKVEPTSPNTLIAFAAKAGSTASDGDSRNSPFTTALVKHLAKPGLDLRKAFGFVRDDVMKVTSNRQEPFVYGSLGGNDVVLVPEAPAAAAPAPAVDPNASVRRDYELAERVGSKAAWDSFIRTYPSGFYTELAQAQRDKLAAEEQRRVATERAKAAAEEQARLAQEGARAAEQAKAAAEAKAAEQARLAAEAKKRAEEEKVAEAERAKTAALAKAAEEARLKEEARQRDEKARAEQAAAAATVAAKPAEAAEPRAIGPVAALPPQPEPGRSALRDRDIAALLQVELRRVGCGSGTADGSWNATAQKALEQFNRAAGMKLDVKAASLEALDAVRGKTARVCPLVCEHGQRADGDRCVRITCRAGYEVGDDNTCEKIEVKKRPEAKTSDRPKDRPETRPEPKPEAQAKSGRSFQERYAACERKLSAQIGTRTYANGAVGSAVPLSAINACAMNGG